MSATKVSGFLLCLVALVAAVLFVWGIVLGDPWRFWAIAIPVIVGFIATLLLVFWIGWTIMTTEEAPPSAPRKEESPPPASSPST